MEPLRPSVAIARVVLAFLLLAPLAVAPARAGQGPEPLLEILEPAQDARVPGPDVAVRLKVRDAELGGQRRDSVFVLLRLDQLPPMKSLAERFTFRGVEPGRHELMAELRRSDGSAFDPRVRATRAFTVTGIPHE